MFGGILDDEGEVVGFEDVLLDELAASGLWVI